MLLKKLTGSWMHEVERVIKTQQKRNKKLVKLLLAHSTTQALRHTPVPPLRPKPALVPVSSSLDDIPLPAPGKWLKFTHVSGLLEGRAGANRMSYWLYLPQKAPVAPMPLMVMLHGCAQTATRFAQSTRMNLLAEQKGFAVLYPQQAAMQNGGRCWRWYKKAVQEGGAEVSSVVDIINGVVDTYGLDRSRIYIAGISAGAAMAQIIALNYPHLIAAVGMHSGSVFGAAETPMEGYSVMQNGAVDVLHSAVQDTVAGFVNFPPMPAILVHGQQDNIVRPVNLAHLAEQFRELHHLAGHHRDTVKLKVSRKPGGPRSGNPYTSYEYRAGRKLLLKVCEVAGLEHAWSGGDGSVTFSDERGPDASKLMWDFFSRHRRATAPAVEDALPSIRKYR